MCFLDSQKDQNIGVGEVGGGMALKAKVLRLNLSYFGHVIWADRLEKDFMLGMGNGTRSRARPRRRWLDEICESTNLDLRQLITIARNRELEEAGQSVTKDRYRSDGTRCDSKFGKWSSLSLNHVTCCLSIVLFQ